MLPTQNTQLCKKPNICPTPKRYDVMSLPNYLPPTPIRHPQFHRAFFSNPSHMFYDDTVKIPCCHLFTRCCTYFPDTIHPNQHTVYIASPYFYQQSVSPSHIDLSLSAVRFVGQQIWYCMIESSKKPFIKAIPTMLYF